MAHPNDFAIHYSLNVRVAVATVGLAGMEVGEGVEERRELVLVD